MLMETLAMNLRMALVMVLLPLKRKEKNLEEVFACSSTENVGNEELACARHEGGSDDGVIPGNGA